MAFGEKDWFACCGSTKFAQEMVSAGPFSSYEQALAAAKDIWFNKVDVNGWLEAFAAHPQIGQRPSESHKSPTFAQWSKGEQSTALATANNSTLEELDEWNALYKKKFGFVFLIFASGRSTPEILQEMKKRYHNRPIVEFELAAQEQIKITELRLSKLYSASNTIPSSSPNIITHTSDTATKAGEDRVSIIGGHLATSKPITSRTRPPITTHVLDIARGHPAYGIEVLLQAWDDELSGPMFGLPDANGWTTLGSLTTDKDGRSGQLMGTIDSLNPGFYKISFNTGKYNKDGFFPHVSIVFEVRDSQKYEHFHVPLLLSQFSFSTYRGS